MPAETIKGGMRFNLHNRTTEVISPLLSCWFFQLVSFRILSSEQRQDFLFPLMVLNFNDDSCFWIKQARKFNHASQLSGENTKK